MSGSYRKLVKGLRTGTHFTLELSRFRRSVGKLFLVEDGDILEDRCDVLVVAVNRADQIGGGLVRDVAERYPREVQGYREIASAGALDFGEVLPFEVLQRRHPAAHARWLVFLPTMADHRRKARLDHVRGGVEALVRWANLQGPAGGAIAIPALGCGRGGLAWNEMRPILENAAARMTNVETHLYAPPTRGTG